MSLAAMQGHVTVSSARWWHVPAVAQLLRESRRRRHAEDGTTIVWAARWSPSLALLQSVWAAPVPGMHGPQSFIAEQGGRAVGLGQMRPRRDPHHWEVAFLAVEPPPAPSGADDDAPRLRLIPDRRATRLAGELCDAAVAAGAERLFVRIPDDGAGYEVFRQVGFTPVVHEFSYYRSLTAGRPPDVPVDAIPGLHPQRRSDAFGVLQLYLESTPKVVQMAEGKRSQSWELVGSGIGRHLSRHGRVQRWVVERDARKVAWLQIVVQRRGPHQVRMLVSDSAGDLIQPLIDFALARCAARRAPGVLVRVREHQPRLMGALEASGFEPIDGTLLMVKQLAARVTERGFARALEKVV